jgi:phage terminase small subunit
MALTPKQETFCRAYIEKGSQAEAYRAAYSASEMKATSVNRAASELFANPRIVARIAELQGELKSAHNVTVASLIAELEEARDVGKERGQASAMVQATLGKARLAGLEKPDSDDDQDVTPVKVVVQVKDARRA